MEKELDDVTAAFGENDFTRDGALSGEFLLGYHCQRQALRPIEQASAEAESSDPADVTTRTTP